MTENKTNGAETQAPEEYFVVYFEDDKKYSGLLEDD